MIASLLLLALAPNAVRVPDVQLATIRGGFALPGGMNISLAVQTDTSVNGALVLRTVFLADQGKPTLQVVTPGAAGGSVLAVGASDAAGRVSVQTAADGSRVELAVPGLDVSHLVGGAFGSVIANSGSGRTIDTVTTVAIDVRGAMPALLGSAMFRADSIVRDALTTGR